MPRVPLRLRLWGLLLAVGSAVPVLLFFAGAAPGWVLWMVPALALTLYPLAMVVTRPLEQLLAVSERLRAGDWKAYAVLGPGTEWAYLGGTILALAQQVAHLTGRFEEEVTARTAELARKANQLRAVGQVGQEVAAVLEPDRLLPFVARVMRGTFGYDLVAILQRQGDDLLLTACAAKGTDDPPVGRAFPVEGAGAPPLARVLLGGEPGLRQVSTLLPSFTMRSELALPIRLGERSLGVIVVQSLRPDAFDAEDLFTVTTIAGQVAVALENARLLQAERQLRDLAITEERNRMAREIHDTLAQGFMGIIMQLRAMRATSDPAAAQFHLETAEQLAQESLQEARRSVWNLRPPSLEGNGLAGALAEEVESLTRRTALRATFTLVGNGDDLSAPAEAALLRIAQEALHNTVKHAAASQVAVRLVVSAQWAELMVVDDGQGFDPGLVTPKGHGGGYGLGAMAERARLLGGSLVVESVPGGGCQVMVRIPLQGRR